MKLNPECMRDVMLQIEKLWKIEIDDRGNIKNGFLHISVLYSALPSYTKEDIYYSLFNLKQAGYIEVSNMPFDNSISEYCVNHMTFAGHEFLNRVRDTKNWSKIQKGMNALRNYSLDAITALSEGFTTAAISAVVKELGS